MKLWGFFGVVVLLAAAATACTEAGPSPVDTGGAHPVAAGAPPASAQRPAGGPLADTAVVASKPTAEAPSTTIATAQPAPVARPPVETALPARPVARATPVPAPLRGPRLSGQVDLEALNLLLSGHGLALDPALKKVSLHALDGVELASQTRMGPGASFSFEVAENRAYLLMAQTVGGVKLWALAPRFSDAAVQNISLRTTYEAGLIYAAEGRSAVSSESALALKKRAGLALDVGADRLVNTVKRVIDNALLWGVDYSLVHEVNEASLRAFGGGLQPLRSLASVVDDPQPDYVPHIYMLNTYDTGALFLDRILMSEMKGDRWSVIVVAEDVPPRVYKGLGGLHVVHGGTTLVYGEEKCFRWTGRQCQIFRQVLVTQPLDAPPGRPPTQVTSIGAFDGAHRPQWSWDERKIAFHAYPEGRLGEAQIFVMNRDGSGLTQLTSPSDGQNGMVPNWSPDNSLIVYTSVRQTFGWDIWVMKSDGSEKRNLSKGRVRLPLEPKFSPDGRRILFDAQDTETQSVRRGGPDWELWVMDRDGSNLRKVTDNDVEDQQPVWGINGVDVVYSVNDKSWEAANILTNRRLFQFPGVTRGRHISPVVAATQHVLVPTQSAIEAKQVTEKGYVNPSWLADKVETGQKVGGYEVATPSKDPLSGIRYEIWTAFTQTPIYRSDVGGWIPPVISWP